MAGSGGRGCRSGRYHFHVRSVDDTVELAEIELVVGDGSTDEAEAGVRLGLGGCGGDVAGPGPGTLRRATRPATRIGQVAQEVADRANLEVEVFDEAALVELGVRLLGINAGSEEPATMVKISYRPGGPADRPSRPRRQGHHVRLRWHRAEARGVSHSQMKNDMSGAAAILAAMTALSTFACPVAVTGWFMCTDTSRPAGAASATS